MQKGLLNAERLFIQELIHLHSDFSYKSDRTYTDPYKKESLFVSFIGSKTIVSTHLQGYL